MPQSSDGHYIEVKGINMYYETYGDGPPLILIHGGTGAGKAQFDRDGQIQKYAVHFTVYVPDSRGHGKTNNPSRKMSYPLMGKDIASFIQALDLEEASICGWSDGGQVALELGIKNIELRAMVVGGAFSTFSEKVANSFRSMGLEEPGKVNFELVQKANPERAEMWKQIHDDWKDTLVDISLLWLTPFNYSEEDLAKISIPTLVLLGDRDQFIEVEEAVKLYRMIPNSELVILPNADHSVSRDQVEKFSSTTLEFLLRHKV